MKRIFLNPAVIETDYNQHLENEGRSTYILTYFCFGLFFFGGGGGREQTPCIDWCNPNEYGFKAFLV